MKYARIERERRFLLAERPAAADALRYYDVDDLYITASRLRLRKVTGADGATIQYKLNQKIARDTAHRIVTSVYLSSQEYSLLSQLPGRRLTKRRYHHRWSGREFGIDVFGGVFDGLVLAEVEAQSDSDLAAVASPPLQCVEVTDRVEFTGGYLAGAVPEAVLGLAASLLRGAPAPQPTNDAGQ
jgi:CYTH domain-containing protein